MNRLHPLARANILADIILILIILLLLFNTARKAPPIDHENYYAEAATVTTVDEIRSRTGFTDDRYRELYLYRTGEWKLGDVVLLVIDGKGTEYIYDDEAVSATLLFYAP